MAAPQPQSVGNALIAKVQDYVEHPERITEFNLRLVEREADQLMKVDVATASTVRAAIAVCRWNYDDVKYWTGNALKNSRSLATLVNAALNYRLIGNIGESVELSMESVQKAPGDKVALEDAGCGLVQAAHYKTALELAQGYTGDSFRMTEAIDVAKSSLQILDNIGVDPIDVSRRIQVAARVAFDKHVRLDSIDMYGVEDYEDGVRFVAALCFPGDIEKEIALDEALVEEFSNDVTWDPMKVSVEFHYLTADDLLSKRPS